MHEVAKFRDDVGDRAGLIDEFNFNLGAAETRLVIWCRHFAGVEIFNQDFRRIASGDTEWRRGRPRQKSDDADFDRCRILRADWDDRHQKQRRSKGRLQFVMCHVAFSLGFRIVFVACKKTRSGGKIQPDSRPARK